MCISCVRHVCYECHNRIDMTPTSFSGGRGFKTRFIDRLSGLRFSIFSSVPKLSITFSLLLCPQLLVISYRGYELHVGAPIPLVGGSLKLVTQGMLFNNHFINGNEQTTIEPLNQKIMLSKRRQLRLLQLKQIRPS
jgi:hypothetical protein